MAQGQFDEWVDRERARPRHRRWAACLRWVAERLGLTPLTLEVETFDVAGGRWRWAVPTGSRTPLPTPGPPVADPRILDGLVLAAHRPADRSP